jgi:hypothetical protein
VLLSDRKEPGSKQPYHVALQLPEKEAAVIVKKLRKSLAEAKRAAADLGELHDGPWRAEEKLAALASWMSLAARA